MNALRLPSPEEIAAARAATVAAVERRESVPASGRVLVTGAKFTEPFALEESHVAVDEDMPRE